MASDIKHLIAEFLDAWNSHDVERIASLYAPNYEGIDVAEAAPQRGPESMQHSAIRYLQAFPDLKLANEWVVIEGNQIAVAWVSHGTHRGRMLNIPPSGRQVKVHGVSFLTLEGDKIVRGLHIWDLAGMLRQIGLLTELPS